MRFSSPGISLGSQIASMNLDFPDFNYARINNVSTWTGALQPFEFEDTAIYRIRIEYRFDNQFSKRPKVWVLSPQLAPNAPHVYPQGDLCLYFPKDLTWSPHKFISKTIIPLTAAWLGFYEVWLKTRIWHGPEAPHKTGAKKITS
jgi:hypothetical protein